MMVLSLTSVALFLTLPSIDNTVGSPKQTPTPSVSDQPDALELPPRRANTLYTSPNYPRRVTFTFETEELMTDNEEPHRAFCLVTPWLVIYFA